MLPLIIKNAKKADDSEGGLGASAALAIANLRKILDQQGAALVVDSRVEEALKGLALLSGQIAALGSSGGAEKALHELGLLTRQLSALGATASGEKALQGLSVLAGQLAAVASAQTSTAPGASIELGAAMQSMHALMIKVIQDTAGQVGALGAATQVMIGALRNEVGPYIFNRVVTTDATPVDLLSYLMPNPGTALVKAEVVVRHAYPTWQPSTVYATVGTKVANGPNIYVLTVAGTSDVAGGPTGVGAGIVDNTCTWDFVVAIGANSYELNGTFRQTAGAITEVSPGVPVAKEEVTAWDAAFATAAPLVKVQGTGEAATTLEWFVRASITEV